MKKVLFLILIFVTSVFAQDWQWIKLSDFSGGLNTVGFPDNIADNQLQAISNFTIKNKNLLIRPGFTKYNTSLISSKGIRGIWRYVKADGTSMVLVADSTRIWKSTDGSTFSVLDATKTIRSNTYVSGVVYNDTMLFVDGSNFYKSGGSSLINGNVVDTGSVSDVPAFVTATTPETVRFIGGVDRTPLLLWLQINSRNPNPNLNSTNLTAGINFLPIGSLIDTSRFIVFVDILAKCQPGDSVLSAVCSLFVDREAVTANENLKVQRNTSFLAFNTSWTNKPSVDTATIDSVNIVDPQVWVTVNIKTWVDSIVAGTWKNYGLTFRLSDETTNTSSNLKTFLATSSNPIRVVLRKVAKEKIVSVRSNVIRDTLKAGTWIDNEWIGYFVEFPTSPNFSKVRYITGNSKDTLKFSPRLFTSDIAGKAYRIVAYPTAIEKVYPQPADSNKIDSVAAVLTGGLSLTDSARYVWIDNQTGLGNLEMRDGTYFLKITQGAGVGTYQVIDNIIAGGTTRLIVFNASTNFVDSTSRFEIFRSVFPKCKYITIAKNRAFFAGDSLSANRVWFSEVKNPGKVSYKNWFIVGGEASEGVITAIAPLHIGYHSDPLEPLWIYKTKSISFLPGDDPTTSPIQKFVTGYGCTYNEGLVSHGGVHLFADYRNFIINDGQQVFRIPASITAPIPNMLLGHVSGFYHDGSVFWSVRDTIDTTFTGDAGFIYSITDGAITQHDFNFAVATSNLSTTDTIPILLGSAKNGQVLKFGTAVTDSGVNITASFTSKWFDMGQPQITKMLREIICSYRGSAAFPVNLVLYTSSKSNVTLATTTASDSVALTEGSVGLHNSLVRKRLSGKSIGKLFAFKLKIGANTDFKLGNISFRFKPIREES